MELIIGMDEKQTVIITELTPERKQKLIEICDEVIDLLIKKHKLKKEESAVVIHFLAQGLSDIGIQGVKNI